MASSRIKSLTKLALLLGAPVALLLALFGTGVHCGHTNRAAILGFERDWLGMDVTVPEPTPVPTPTPTPTPVTPTPTPVTTPTPVVTPTPVTTPTPIATPTPVVTPTPVTPVEPIALASVRDPIPLTVTPPAPLPADLQARLAEPVRVRVTVLVDPELVDRRPDWIAYTQRHIAWASQILEAQVGVHLDLRGVMVWPDPPRTGLTALVTAVQQRPRDGADLVLGFSERSFAGAPMLTAAADHNLGHALVQANPGSRAPHLRGLLHAVGQSLGAFAIRDAASEPWRGGSFMADVLAPDTQAITLDDASRTRLLERKALPFADTAGDATGDANEPDNNIPSLNDPDDQEEH